MPFAAFLCYNSCGSTISCSTTVKPKLGGPEARAALHSGSGQMALLGNGVHTLGAREGPDEVLLRAVTRSVCSPQHSAQRLRHLDFWTQQNCSVINRSLKSVLDTKNIPIQVGILLMMRPVHSKD